MGRRADHSPPCTVLLVEDDQKQLEILKELLESWGCRPLLASSYGQAVALLQARPRPDVAVVDYNIEQGKTGVMVIEELRRQCGSGTPALVLTGNSSQEVRDGVEACRATLFHKPVDATLLCTAVLSLCRISHAPQRHRWPH